MRLFQSIFGRDDVVGRYPETLIESAMERAVGLTDVRLHLVAGYRKRLRQPIIHAIDQVMALVDAIPVPLAASLDGYRGDFRLAALFASGEEMLRILGRDKGLRDYLSSAEGRGADQVTGLLVARREERNILGMDLVGDQVRRDVAQVSVSFAAHRLLEVNLSEPESRRFLKRRAFDHVLALALAEITEARVERADLQRQRVLLQRKLKAVKQGTLPFGAPGSGQVEEAGIQAELDTVSAQLAELGADAGVLKTHLDLVADRLADAEHQVWSEDVDICLDPLNIRRDPDHPSARQMVFQELHDARGQRAVMLLLSIAPRDLPPVDDFVSAAERYL